MIPSHTTRELQGLTQQIHLTSYTLNKKSHNTALSAIFETLEKCKTGLVVNKSMMQASKYRRYVRELQKKWKSKYENRMKILMMYCEQQLQITLKGYPQLKVVEAEFWEKNASRTICEQYQKDVAGRLKEYRDNYLQRLE